MYFYFLVARFEIRRCPTCLSSAALLSGIIWAENWGKGTAGGSNLSPRWQAGGQRVSPAQ